jgi:hypothetical protein
MVQRIGGETPIIKYGTELSVEGPADVTVSHPVLAGDIFKLGGTGADGTGYKVVDCSDGDDSSDSVLVMALHNLTDLNVPLGVKILGAYGLCQVRRLRYYTGVPPTIGQSIEISGSDVRRIEGLSFAPGKGYVLAIDTTALEAEVLV